MIRCSWQERRTAAGSAGQHGWRHVLVPYTLEVGHSQRQGGTCAIGIHDAGPLLQASYAFHA
jgi:hypothetical protein